MLRCMGATEDAAWRSLCSRTGTGGCCSPAHCYPVSVHAALRTVSLTLPVASKAAEGSKP